MLGEAKCEAADSHHFFGADESGGVCSFTRISSELLSSSPAELARVLSNWVRFKSTHSWPSGKCEPGEGGRIDEEDVTGEMDRQGHSW